MDASWKTVASGRDLMETKKIVGRVDEVSRKEGAKGDFYSIKLGGRSYTIFGKTPAFDTMSDKLVKLGDAVEIEFTETQGTFKGAPVTYKNGISIKKVTEVPATSTPSATPTNEIWEAKDRRIVRMASINAAIELAKTNFMALPEEVQKAGMSPTLITGLAKQFEEWVYRKETTCEVEQDEYN